MILFEQPNRGGSYFGWKLRLFRPAGRNLLMVKQRFNHLRPVFPKHHNYAHQ